MQKGSQQPQVGKGVLEDTIEGAVEFSENEPSRSNLDDYSGLASCAGEPRYAGCSSVVCVSFSRSS